MFIWNRKIYMDDKVRKSPYKYRKMVERKKIAKACYCITLPANNNNLMDIYSSRELWFKYRRLMGLEIIGMAAGKESAFQMAGRIVRDIYTEKGYISPEALREFFE